MAISKIGSNAVDTLSSKLTLTAADGVEDNDYIMELTNAEATDGRSYGLRVKAGSTSADQSFVVQDHDASNTLLKVTGDGDVNVGIGDILFGTAGKGINLGVTSNTDSNTLDDYEEGTWTPSLISGSGITFSDSEENYVKIGRVVYINISCSFSGTSSNRVEISGLPFASSDTSAFTIFHSGGSLPSGAAFLAQTHSGHNRLSGGKSATDMSYTDVNGTTMRITGTYLATA